MSILEDIEKEPPQRTVRWIDKLAAKDPEYAEAIRELIRGWWAGKRAQGKKSKNALAEYIRDYDSNRVGVRVQAITDLIDELKGEAN